MVRGGETDGGDQQQADGVHQQQPADKAMVCPTSFKLPTKPPLSKGDDAADTALIMFMVVPGRCDGRDIGMGGREVAFLSPFIIEVNLVAAVAFEGGQLRRDIAPGGSRHGADLGWQAGDGGPAWSSCQPHPANVRLLMAVPKGCPFRQQRGGHAAVQAH